MARTYAVGIGPSKSDVDAALVEAAHARCLDIHPYTVNETAEMEDLIALGVDGMFTNFPDRLEAVLGKKRPAESPARSWPPKRPGPAGPDSGGPDESEILILTALAAALLAQPVTGPAAVGGAGDHA